MYLLSNTEPKIINMFSFHVHSAKTPNTQASNTSADTKIYLQSVCEFFFTYTKPPWNAGLSKEK